MPGLEPEGPAIGPPVDWASGSAPGALHKARNKRGAAARLQGNVRAMVDRDDSLLREVEEDLRRERIAKLWDAYGIYAIAALLAIIIGIGGYKFMEHRRVSIAQAAGTKFDAAAKDLAANKSAEAEKALNDLVSNGPGGYALLARLRMAAAYAKAGKTGEAVAAYELIGKETSVDPLLASYARLQAATLRLDSADWTEMQNRLNDLAADKAPWRASARELLGLAAYKAGKTDEARQYFLQLIGDSTTPPGIAERSRILMAMMTEGELSHTGQQQKTGEGAAPAPAPAAPKSN